MRRLLPLLLLLTVVVACGGARERPSSPNPVNAPLCDTCIDLNWEDACYSDPVTCADGSDETCWSALLICVDEAAADEAQCWRSCKATRQWPDAPFPDSADFVLCNAGCDLTKWACRAQAQTSTAANTCGDEGFTCRARCGS